MTPQDVERWTEAIPTPPADDEVVPEVTASGALPAAVPLPPTGRARRGLPPQ